MDKEYEATRELLGKTREKTAPVGLGDAIMRKVQAIEEKRVERSIVWALVLRGACIVVFVCLLSGALVPVLGRIGEVDWWKLAEGVVALSLLAGGIRVFRILVL
jgi:hypothetical protein